MRISDWSSDVCSSDLHLPNRVDSQLAVIGRVVVGQDPDEASIFASTHVQATGNHGWMPEMGIGEVSVSALWPLARKPPCMQHPRIKMVRCAGTLPATFGHARRRMDVLAYSHGS